MRENIEHPSSQIIDLMLKHSVSTTQLAAGLDMSISQVDRLLSGQRGVSLDLAKKLEAVLGRPSNEWLKDQCLFEMKSGRIKTRRMDHPWAGRRLDS